jgi:hypothetical protein
LLIAVRIAAAQPAFEVATIKPNASNARRNGEGRPFLADRFHLQSPRREARPGLKFKNAGMDLHHPATPPRPKGFSSERVDKAPREN